MADVTSTVLTKMELDTKDVDKKLGTTEKATKKLEKQQKSTKKESRDLSGALQGITGRLSGMLGPMGGAITGLAGMTKGFKGLKFAIAATGIGALLIAMGALVAYFQSSEEGQDKLNKIMAVFGVIVGNISDVIADFGAALISAFEDPKQALADLGEFIKENLINRLKAVGVMGRAIARIFSGEFKEGLEDLANGAVQLGTGVEDAIGKATRAVGEFIAETDKEIKQAKQVADLSAATDKLEREQLVRRSKLEAEIAELRLKARQDDQFGAEERLSFLDDAQRLSEELLSTDQQIAQNRLDEQRITNSFSKSNKDNLKAEAEAEAVLNNITTKRLTEQRALEREALRIKKEILTAQKAATADEERIRKEELKAAEAEIKRLDKEAADEADRLAAEREALDARKEQAADRMFDIEKTREELAAMELESIAMREETLIQIETDRMDRLLANDELIAEERAVIYQQFQDKITAIARTAEGNRIALAEQEASDKGEIERAALDSFKILASEGAKHSKELAIFNTLLNAGEAIVASAKLGFPLAIPGILAATILGATQLSNLQGQSPPSFARGGKIGGRRHSAGGTMINAERGEVILNRRSMANPVLRTMASRINQAGGGVAFAQEGMLVGQSSINAKIGSLGSEFDSSLRNNRAVLVTEDFDAVQNRVLVTEDRAAI